MASVLTLSAERLALLLLFQSPQPPIMVKLIDPPKDSELANLVVGALGLTGALTLLAVLFGVVLAGVIFWVRSRSAQGGPTDAPPR